MIQDKLDELIQSATQARFSDEICKAKTDYHKETGEIYDDDKFYENRMSLFLEWYTFDYILAEENITPAELCLKNNTGEWNADVLSLYENFLDNVHAIFVMKKIRDDYVVALNLFDNTEYRVSERSGRLLFRKNDIFQGRIISVNGTNHFTGSFCFHPQGAHKFIKSEAEKVAVVQNGCQKDLKRVNSSLEYLNKQIGKIVFKIEKLKDQIEKCDSEKKITKLKNELEEYTRKHSDFELEIRENESERHDILNRRIRREVRALSNKLIHRLAYMHLKWERSRQIDIHDIYRNHA